MLTVSETDLGTPEATWLAHPRLAGLAPLRSPFAGIDHVVVVAPHPDDEILGAGGLLRASARAGLGMSIVAVTDGEASHPGSAWTGERLATRRRNESADALSRLGLIGVDVQRCAIADGAVAESEADLATALTGLLDRTTLCLATWRHDGHPDHDATGRAAAAAAAASGARLIEYPIWAWHWATPDGGLPLDRARRLDLSDDDRRAKARAITAFTSQIAPLGPGAADRIVLPPAIRARFGRRFETFLVAGEAA